jgi:single-stranded-DNA-specific exonuclease RecJ
MGFQNQRIWNIQRQDETVIDDISSELSISKFITRLLVARGLDTAQKAKSFLKKETAGFHDPFLLKDMDKAVRRIHEAIDNGEKITIYGDYDVDGVTSVAALYLYLTDNGADVDYYVPERLSEGYGLNITAIDKLSENGTNLIITVDSGITAKEEVKYAMEKGIETVITDHHECREGIPDAYAVVNPHRKDSEYPFRELAGVGVVFKLICALDGNTNIKRLCALYSDIVAVGTIADVMPLVDENRLIVSIGLYYLENTKNFGLSALINEAFYSKTSVKKRKINSSSIGFGIAPRINAAGRVGDVKRAVDLLVTDNVEIAQAIAQELCLRNSERQLIENIILEEAIAQIEKTHDFENDRVIVISSDSWHLGVIGIVSSRITEKYGLPSVLISFDGEPGKGSCRSVKGFNINQALSHCKDYLIKSGGHELAAGLSIEKSKLADFQKAINKYASSVLTSEHLVTYIDADFEIDIDDISVEKATELSLMEPFGLENPVPVFFISNMTIINIVPIGQDKHLKLILEKDGMQVTALYFNTTLAEFQFVEKCTVDCLFQLDINEFRGTKSIQMILRDLRSDEMTDTETQKQNLFYQQATIQFACAKENIPTINHFKSAFLYLKRKCEETNGVNENMNVFYTAKLISERFRTQISACMLNIMLDVFAEMNLISLLRLNENMVNITILQTKEKVNLNDSTLLKNINNNCKGLIYNGNTQL